MHFLSRFRIASLCLTGLVATNAQQFTQYSYPWDLLNVTEACFTALNTTVSSCPSFLARNATGDSTVGISSEDSLTLLCVDDCRSELETVQTSIESACTGIEDVMTYEDTVYPATFMVDNLLYTYDVSCYKDSSTGEYCDLILAEWRQESNDTDTDHDCDDCTLGPMKLQLESPLGYDEDWASEFASMTSSCGVTGYEYTSPAAYASSTSIATTTTGSTIASTTATSGTATESCSSTYTVQLNDTCNSIAASQNISTYNLMLANSIIILCSNLPEEGEEICIPALCSTTTLQHGDSCDDYESSWGVSLAKILAWNPIISSSCDNLDLFVGWSLCTGPTDDWAPATTAAVTTTIGTAVAMPTNGMSSSNQNCAKWYTIGTDDDCATVSLAEGISTDEFLFLNPEVWSNCTNLWVNYAYCVEAVGDVSTYSGWTETATTTVFTKPTTTTTTWTVGPTYTLAHAPGTETDCEVYREPYNATVNPMKTLGISTDYMLNMTTDFSACSYYADQFQVTVDEIVTWNPSLDAENCTLEAAYSYCVLISYDYISSRNSNETEDASNCLSVNSTWIMVGTATNCECYTIIYGKQAGGLDCDMLVETDSSDPFTLDEAKLVLLNPWIGTGDCTTGLFSNLTGEEVRAVCLATELSTTSTAVATSTPTDSGTSTNTLTTTTSASSATVAAQPGIIDTCDDWHEVVSGDTSQSIADDAGISLDTFYEWNPEVGSDCSSMWLGYGVCVGVSS